MGYFDRLDFGSDLLVMYGLDSGVLKVEGLPDVPLTNCILDEPIDTHEMEPSAGQVPQMDSLKIWPTSFSAKPPLGSVIVDGDDTYWTILAVRFKSIVKCWEAHVRNLSIMPSVYNVATVLKAHFGKGRANEAKPEWRGLISGHKTPTDADKISARFQPATEEAVLRFDAEWSRENFRVILDKPLPLSLANGEYRIVDQSGAHYRILKSFDQFRIDRKPILLAVKILEGVEYFQPGGPPADMTQPTFPTA